MPDDIAPTPPYDCSMCSEFLAYSREENRRLRWSAWTWAVLLGVPAAVVMAVGLRHV